MPVTLDAATRALLDGPNFAVVATLTDRGRPRSSAVWIGRDGDTLVFFTPADSGKARDLRRDPRTSVTVLDAANPYVSAEFRGTAEVTEDGVAAWRDRLSLKYLGHAHASPDDRPRVLVRVTPRLVVPFPPA
jgi:PPOX class probable F420-dependent enzyme